MMGAMAGSMMGAMDWLMGKETQRETTKEKQIDYNEGEKIDYNSEEEILFPRRIIMPNLHKRTYKTEMKEEAEEFVVKKKRLSDKGKFEEGSVTSADEVPIHTGENIKKHEGDSRSMRAESIIGTYGGTLDIQNTGVNLKIPPGALQRDYCIQMRIIPHHETELSFASNSSVVVELLPNNVKLLIPATLTLPHCLVLKKKCERKAKVYSSHHKKGTRPQWEEEINTQCELAYQNCVMRLNNFCWKKVKIGDDIVEAKRIVLFAAQRFSSTKYVTFLDVGYYWQLPGCREVLKLNDVTSLHEIPFVFCRKGQMPLTVLFEKVRPPIWRYQKKNKKKVIKFITVAITNGSFCTFNLNKMGSDETDGCDCFIKAGQGSDLEELMFSLKESSLSRAEAIIPSTGNGTAGDSQEELPSAVSQTIVPDKFLQKLANKLGNCWKDVGRNLELTDGQLDILDLTYNSNHKEKVYQMLLVWKRQNTIAATHGVLAGALGNTERGDLRDWVLGGSEPK
ncbi:uncharacterized protein [Apostichopus japonicus]|uniref:uncharacterized protein n=1 Tax=Stichopus japonicus TaxID=307972 RepID=UPI003AB2DA64